MSANFIRISKFSPFFIPRPPDTTRVAEVNSGLRYKRLLDWGGGHLVSLNRSAYLSDFWISSETKRLSPVGNRKKWLIRHRNRGASQIPGDSTAGASSTGAELEPSAAFSKEVPRTVATLTESLLFTLAIAFPAYIGRVKVFSSSTLRMSEMAATSSFTATRGMKFLPKLLEAARMWE